MKKLIALLFCLAVMATAARAEYPKQAPEKNAAMQQAVDQNIEAAQRTTVLRIMAAGQPDVVQGKAILAGFTDNYKKMVLITTRDLAVDMTEPFEDAQSMTGAVLNGPVKVSGALDYRHVRVKGATNLIKITMDVKLQGSNLAKAKQFKMISDEQAVSFAKKLQGKDDKAVEEYRKGIIDTGRRK